jgi:hypothetical protein
VRARLTAVVLLLVGGAAAGCAADPGTTTADLAGAPAATGVAPAPADTRLVLISGRDDHGMVAEEQVPLYDEVEGTRPSGSVRDGTYARVLATDGQWLKVETVEGRHATGWIDDFFLRGESRLVGPAPTCEAGLAGKRRTGGTLVVVHDLRGGRARVETVSEPSTAGWVDRELLQELPPQGPRCGDVPLDDKHAHHH